MKLQKDDSLFISMGLIALIIGAIIAGVIIHAPKKGSVKVSVVPALPSSFPDVKNDPNYKNFLNSNALDPTQAVQLGNSNSSPFNSSQ